ncbi:carbonic anhydrase 2 isoform X2 [Nematostella vectensis]|nr:carbonic anhydrase 2 isoform X2 [Nematostella vectensis]XP_032232914.2 carbonic anhydrase 2 isoform X2 [Nematostella vectensis]
MMASAVGLLVVLVALVASTKASGGGWKYGETKHGVYGPEDWGKVSHYCDGRSQSPIDFSDIEDNDDDDDNALEVRFSSEGVSGEVTNNGHSPTFAILKGSATLGDYTLGQFHVHFGCREGRGSEHTVQGTGFDGEIHMVFFKTVYGSVEKAADKTDGLTVVGVFLKKASSSSTMLQTLTKNMEHIKSQGTKAAYKPIKLDKLVPGLSSGKRAYYNYKGSLTTPPCYESVNWIVLKNPILVTLKDLWHLRMLQSSHGKQTGKMCDNFRPVQKLNGRKLHLFE